MKSTDNQEELFVVVDRNDNIIGKATRGECHNNRNLIHRAIDVNLINGDKILLQRRSMNKDIQPGKLDSSAAGHVSYGETYEQTTIREIKEELGIDIKEKDLIFIGKTFLDVEKEREIDMNFAVKTNLSPNKIKFDKKEVSEVIYKNIEEIKEMLKENKKQFTRCFPPVFEQLCKHFGW